MLDFGLFEIRTDVFLLILSVLVLSLQLFLCRKAKHIWLRFMPTILFAGLTIVFAVMAFLFDGWDSIGFLFLALCSAFLLLTCGIGWGIWGVVKRIGSKKNERITK